MILPNPFLFIVLLHILHGQAIPQSFSSEDDFVSRYHESRTTTFTA